ncbi:Mur ligase middle domain protein [Marvinbryantia formatexigens DSM 14469]|uniref:Lipid II isoglutaminyl synthase (glutamine-hydrolyzing) subunit MurT n=1 Tax=Marvinbryantia formatexigens DSM 14469 TaxID=478749 RepID=C6LKK9_9FIRM|nr:MurT ligase domain-containing protein [Marvinbryantia formatexigens]EET58908.1 Mur ligase middle domain protein [Marvinbryantia formatexigens DSM 14469]UWO26704.1 MurT ligase domain-containing protein [Marvinbryantia formatexigens DSM 14469]SDG88819.1 UDP-N-acetylmuramyl tripeptide synthase [Marvinbryantia formatexigens]
MRLRRIAAVWTAKLTARICKMLGKQGVTWAGKIALMIDPKILTELAGDVKEKIYVVCGTNGKTTTNNLLCSTLEAQKKKVVCNHTGSNMLNGCVASFVLAAGWNGKLDADYACIEVDEASALRIFPHFKPDFMVLTNLFRDQLDRYGEIDITMNLVRDAMKLAPDMKIIVNADDALSVFVTQESKNPYVTYGIGEKVFDESINEIKEGRFCKKCGAKMEYHFYHFSQLGDYYCSSCDFKRPQIKYNASDIETGNHLAFTVENRRIRANYRGFYNIYNILASYAAAREAGLPLENFQEVLDAYNPENGRNEHFSIDGTEIILNLAKNPAGFNQNISAVMEDKSLKDIIILINDNDQDGTDVSWLWDVDFDRFQSDNINSIVVSGIRCQDMRLRLKYVDIPAEIEPDVEKAIRERIAHGCKNLYVLVNYTGLYSTHNILKRMEEAS